MQYNEHKEPESSHLLWLVHRTPERECLQLLCSWLLSHSWIYTVMHLPLYANTRHHQLTHNGASGDHPISCQALIFEVFWPYSGDMGKYPCYTAMWAAFCEMVSNNDHGIAGLHTFLDSLLSKWIFKGKFAMWYHQNTWWPGCAHMHAWIHHLTSISKWHAWALGDNVSEHHQMDLYQ